MPRVERRTRALAAQACAVLRKQRVEALHTYATAVVHRVGIRVGTGQAHALAEASSHLKAAGVVDGIETIGDQLDHAVVWKRRTRAHTATACRHAGSCTAWHAGNGLIG